MVEPTQDAIKPDRELKPDKAPRDGKVQKLGPMDWQTIIGLLGLAGAALAFFYHWSNDIAVRDRESRKPFLDKQLAIYAKTLPVVAKLQRLWAIRMNADNREQYYE